MDRAIKFRVWLKDEQEMYGSWEAGFRSTNQAFWGNRVAKRNTVLMQYTGLKDKNGQEIYEGDIVLLENEVPRGDGQFDDEIGEVVWDNSGACFLFKSNLGTEYLGHAHPDRVIGNKFENQRLLD